MTNFRPDYSNDGILGESTQAVKVTRDSQQDTEPHEIQRRNRPDHQLHCNIHSGVVSWYEEHELPISTVSDADCSFAFNFDFSFRRASYFSLSKVYANTLLATLNARTALVNSAHKPTRSSGSGISSQTHHNSNYLWRDMELRPADTGSTGVHGIHTTAVDIDISNNDSVQALELKVS